MGDKGSPGVALAQAHGINGFADRADLIQLDQRRICQLLINTALTILNIGYKQAGARNSS